MLESPRRPFRFRLPAGTLLLAMLALFGQGCSTSRNLPYEKAVSEVETLLNSKVFSRSEGHFPSPSIYPFSKEVHASKTEFDLTEGSGSKADHAFPLKVGITVHSRKDGQSSSFRVNAVQHSLLIDSTDNRTAGRWAEMIRQVITDS